LKDELLVPTEAIATAEVGGFAALGVFGLLVWLVGNLSSQEAEKE
jgi:hypothetical protein